jgi:predicted ester cyclase
MAQNGSIDPIKMTDARMALLCARLYLRGGKQRSKGLRSIYSDVTFTMEDQIADGDKVVIRWTFRGKHVGEYMGAKPTGKEVTATGMNLFRLADGKIAEVWVASDDLGELQQLGVITLPNQ